MLEREIERQVCEYATKCGFLTYKFSSPSRIGVPDRMFLGPYQRAFWIEFKREGGQPTPAQTRECLKIRKCGFEVYLVDTVEDGKKVIDEQVQESLASVFAQEMICRVQAECNNETKH